jgi:hypothetical protein
MFECYTCQRSIHEPSFECGASEDEKAFTMEVSGTRRWLCPFCRLEITMAVARNLLDVEDEEHEQRDDWEDSTGADTEAEDGMEVKDYGHRTAYPVMSTRSLFSGAPIVESEDEAESLEAEALSSEPGQAESAFPIPEVAPKKSITWGENQVQEYPISKRDIRDRRYADSVMEADPRYAKEQALIAQSEQMATAATSTSEPEAPQMSQLGEEKPGRKWSRHRKGKR